MDRFGEVDDFIREGKWREMTTSWVGIRCILFFLSLSLCLF